MIEKPEKSSTQNEVFAASGHVVQSGTHLGDINFHQSTGRLPIPRQLPAMPKLFVGREEELERLSSIATRAPDGNSIIISAVGGTGGIGKTWLGLRWAHENIENFPDGQLFIDLHGFDPVLNPTSPATAVRGFLDAFEVAVNRIPVGLDAQIGLYRSLVAGRRMLVFIDNAYDVEQVLPLLPGSSSCTVIITSRHQLASLVTSHNALPLHLGTLPDNAARDALIQRIGLKRVEEEPGSAAELAGYCAGLPLALSIVAARIVISPNLSLSDLAKRLRARESRLVGLDGGDDRSSLTTVFSWSYRGLQAPTARIFCMLSLAPGSDISLLATVNLVGQPTSLVEQALGELERASLIQQHTSGRWRMHDLVKLYAANEAEASVSWQLRLAGLKRLVDFYLHSAHTADRLINPRRPPIRINQPPKDFVPAPLQDKASAQRWLEEEHSCLLAAHRIAQQHDWHDAVWQLSWALDTFHYRRGLLNNRIDSLRAGLDATQRGRDDHGTFMAHRLLGHAYVRIGDYRQATEHLSEALSIAKRAGDLLDEAHTHTFFIKAWGQQGNDERALSHARKALVIFQDQGNPAWIVQSLNFVGWHSARLGQHQDALDHCTRALTLSRQHDDRQGEADALNSLGYLAQLRDENRKAIDYYSQAFDLFHNLGHDYYEADVLDRIGEAYHSLGDYVPAQDSWRQALALYRRQHRTTEAERVLGRLRPDE